MMAKTFQCSVVTPKERVLDETVTYATIPGWDGQVGLMPGRAPMLVKLGQGAMRLEYPEGGQRWFYVDGGVAQMAGGTLTLLATEATPADHLAKREVDEAWERASGSVAKSDDEVAERDRMLARARTMRALVGRGSA